MLSRYLISVSAALAATLVPGLPALQLRALPVDTYTSSSRLAEGKWVKVRITEEGMQLLSNDALKKLGFSDPSKVHVFGYGGQRITEDLDSTYTDDLPLQPCARTADGLVFFGSGTVAWKKSGSRVVQVQNPYSNASYYFLSDAPLREGDSTDAPKVKVAYGSDDTRVNTFTQYLLHENELNAAGNTGSDLFGEDFRTTTTRTFDFDLPGAADDQVKYRVAFGWYTSTSSSLQLSSNGTELLNVNYEDPRDKELILRLDYKDVVATQPEKGKGSLTVKFNGSGVTTKALLDFIMCSYERELRLDGSPLLFNYMVKKGEYKVLNVSGVSDNTIIWDVTDPANIKAVDFTRSGDVASFAPTAVGFTRYVAFNPSQVSLTPTGAGSVVNQDLHSMPTPDMVIISPKEFKAQAERVAELHRTNDDMAVYVLTPEQIYNEFSCGTPDVTAYRKLLKMWYDRTWKSSRQVGQCLLFGRTTYDQRELTDNLKAAKYPRILTWQSTINANDSKSILNETNSFMSDNYIAMLEDYTNFSFSNAKLKVGVGRMPVKSVSEARTMVDKLYKFVNSPEYGAWRNNVLILADDGDHADHAEQSQSMYERMLRYGGDDKLYERIYIDAYDYGTSSYKKTYPQAKAKMLKLIEEGVSLWTYIGHANPTSLTGEDMWTYTDLSTMTNKRWPVMYNASCEFIRMDSDAVSGCETMWLHPDAGLIAAIAANRKVYITQNGLMSNSFGEQYFRRDAEGNPRTLGEIYMSAINGAGSDDNKHRFSLMGNPALRAPIPTYHANVETIADCEVDSVADEADYPVIPGLSKMKVSGTVTDKDGNLLPDFNGSLVATLYDAEVVVTTKGHNTASGSNDDSKIISYNDRKNKLFSGKFPVNNGRWDATLLLPEEIENATTRARLTLHATPEGEGADAAGATDKFYIYGWADDLAEDTKDPEILYMYLNNSAFRNGATVGPDPVFKAKVRDESGINISNAGVGRLLTVTIDSNKVFDNLGDYYVTEQDDPGAGTITYPLTGLSEGEHTLEFLVWDNAGNSSRSGFNFRIAPQSEIPDLNIYTDASPAVSSVTFFIDSPEAVVGLVEVFDLSGRRVWYSDAPKNDGALSAKWNLNDTGGSRVPRGIYLYRATVRDSAGKEMKATKKFAVGNP